MGLNNAALFAYHPALSGSLLCFSILQYGSLSCVFFFFFLKPFHLCVFSALYCCVGEAQGREGLTMHCGTECSYSCMGEDGGDYFEWMFLGKERRRIPGGGGFGRDHSKHRTFL